jgi:hypothetical protein
MEDVQLLLLTIRQIWVMVSDMFLLAILAWPVGRAIRLARRSSHSAGNADEPVDTKSAALASDGLEAGSAGEQDGGLGAVRGERARKRQHDACQLSPDATPTEKHEPV